jgi:hypothetical protein
MEEGTRFQEDARQYSEAKPLLKGKWNVGGIQSEHDQTEKEPATTIFQPYILSRFTAVNDRRFEGVEVVIFVHEEVARGRG